MRRTWVGLGVLYGVALLVNASLTWQHLHHWGPAKRLVHLGLIVLFGAAGGQRFRRATK
jgi:hypothetical protein